VLSPVWPGRNGSALPRVEVVLSTYRARADWLEQQLESLWAQEGVEVSLLVRDDGSGDGTVALLERLLTGRPARLLPGENVGPGRSFLLGLQAADPSAEHVAFCDQDDVWLPDKLRRAVEALRALPSPAMYSARVELVDERLRPLGLHQLHGRGHSFANALVQCAATGCTIVLDRAAADLLARESPTGTVLHDAWAYLVLTGCGTTVYDPRPVVRYRQHSANVVGVANTRRARWSGRLRRQVRSGHERVHTLQDRALARHYAHDLRPTSRRLLQRHLAAADGGVLRRIAWGLCGLPHRQDAASDAVYRVLFALGRV
jgi:glycosyltransferase involved in cell wall biosynthesis